MKWYAFSFWILWWAFFCREKTPPEIQNSDCEDCPICRSRSSQLKDNCDDIHTTTTTQFYAMVVAHKDYRKATVVFSGMNLKSVELYNDKPLNQSSYYSTSTSSYDYHQG